MPVYLEKKVINRNIAITYIKKNFFNFYEFTINNSLTSMSSQTTHLGMIEAISGTAARHIALEVECNPCEGSTQKSDHYSLVDLAAAARMADLAAAAWMADLAVAARMADLAAAAWMADLVGAARMADLVGAAWMAGGLWQFH